MSAARTFHSLAAGVASRLRRRCVISLLTALIAIPVPGCSIPTWMAPQPNVFDTSVSKEQLIAHLNRNVIGSGSRPGLMSWRSSNAQVQVAGFPPAPASVAVEAPRNFRMSVSMPVLGGQVVDIGSNKEIFWMWSKEQPNEIFIARQEEIGLAMEYFNAPVPLHPDWLMEVFGVVPIHPAEFEMVRLPGGAGDVELVAHRKSPLGHDVDRVIRVNLARGRIVEHSLRSPGGHVIARALLDDYTTTPDGTILPLKYGLQWPEARMEMTITLRNPEVNSPALAHNDALWQLPNIRGARPVDIGSLARRSREAPISPTAHLPVVSDNDSGWAPLEPGQSAVPPGTARLQETLQDAPRWQAQPVGNSTAPFAAGQRSAYSSGAWRSSSVPRLPALE